MPIPLPLPAPYSDKRSRLIAGDFVRHRALERLYERKAAVEDLIRSLEQYQRASSPNVINGKVGRAEVIEFSAPRRCLSGSAR